MSLTYLPAFYPPEDVYSPELGELRQPAPKPWQPGADKNLDAFSVYRHARELRCLSERYYFSSVKMGCDDLDIGKQRELVKRLAMQRIDNRPACEGLEGDESTYFLEGAFRLLVGDMCLHDRPHYNQIGFYTFANLKVDLDFVVLSLLFASAAHAILNVWERQDLVWNEGNWSKFQQNSYRLAWIERTLNEGFGVLKAMPAYMQEAEAARPSRLSGEYISYLMENDMRIPIEARACFEASHEFALNRPRDSEESPIYFEDDVSGKQIVWVLKNHPWLRRILTGKFHTEPANYKGRFV